MITYNTLWQHIIEDIKQNEPGPAYKIWFEKTAYIDGSESEILIACPNQIIYNQLETKYRKKLEALAKKLMGQTIDLRFIVQPVETKEESQTSSPLFDELPSYDPHLEASMAPELSGETAEMGQTSSSASPLSHNSSGSAQTFLNPNYTFEQFVVGGTNRVAHAAALAVTDQPGSAYNPLFIYGGTGVGKTHLVQAIGNELLKRKPKPKILYFSSEKFVNEFVESLRFGRGGEFKKRYRSADVLIVDDVQFLAGKGASMEEFFHTFNELHSSNRQIILCSDRPPREIAQLTDRLISRFEGGLMVDISSPDFETRSAIIRNKADKLDIPLSPEVADFIASLAPDNIRALEGLMLKLKSLALATQEPLTLSVVQTLFHSPTPQPVATPKRLSPNQILKVVCDTYGVTLKDITGKSRTQTLVTPRQMAMYILREDGGLNYDSIGQLLGGRDHTTVMHGVVKMTKLAQTDDQTRLSLSALRAEILG